MYIPEPFQVTDKDTLYDFIDSHSFGIVVSNGENAPEATHLPLLLDRQNDCLTGHFARKNEQWTRIDHREVLVIFHGPHHYISPAWYETPLSVPTWNYVAVHVYGAMTLIEDKDELMHSLLQLVRKFEQPDSAYRIDEKNMDFVRGLMKGIVGFNIRIQRIEGKWKLSQNHSLERQQGVIQGLESLHTEPSLQMAELMKKNISGGRR